MYPSPGGYHLLRCFQESNVDLTNLKPEEALQTSTSQLDSIFSTGKPSVRGASAGP